MKNRILITLLLIAIMTFLICMCGITDIDGNIQPTAVKGLLISWLYILAFSIANGD